MQGPASSPALIVRVRHRRRLSVGTPSCSGTSIFVLVIAAARELGSRRMRWLRARQERRRRSCGEQLPDVLSILASSLRAGSQLPPGARHRWPSEIKEPAGRPSSIVWSSEIRLGRTDRRRDGRARPTGSAARTCRWAVTGREHPAARSAGNLAEVLDIVANTVRERAYVQRQVRCRTAEGRTLHRHPVRTAVRHLLTSRS